jgi:hypothetical protein
MTTIDLIDVFCRQSIINIDPIDVFLTIGAQLQYASWHVLGLGGGGGAFLTMCAVELCTILPIGVS